MELKTKDISKTKFNNNRFSLTNGQIFLLGILEENVTKDSPVFVAKSEPKNKELFNPLFTIIKANNQLLSPNFHQPINHSQAYQLEEDIVYRSTTYLVDDIKIFIESERFLDREDMIVYTQYRFRTSGQMTIDLYHGIDDTSIVADGGVNAIRSKLHDMSLKTIDDEYIAIIYNKDFRHKNWNEKNQPTEHYNIVTEADRTYTLTKVIGYGPTIRRLKKLLKYKMNQSYETIKEDHIQYKKNELRNNLMNVVNNKKLDVILAYVYRQYLNDFPCSLSINQTGLNIFSQLYFHLFNKPEKAREILLSQISKLKQYKKFAESLGYQGAIVIDNLNDFYAGNRTIYQGAFLIYMIDLYQEMTNDLSLINAGVLELSIEITKFYVSYGEKTNKTSQIDFNNVSNLNLTLNHINNHTFTNHLIRKASEITKLLISSNIHSENLSRYSQTELSGHIDKLNELHKKIFIQDLNDNDLLYPYQNFMIDMETNRLETKNETMKLFLDQFMLFMLFNKNYSMKEIEKNIGYFSKLANQSKLNQLFFNLVSNDIIKDEDFKQFIQSVSIFKESLLINSQGIDFGVMGLVYMFVTYRLSGLRYDKHKFTVDSLISKDIRRLEYDIHYRQFVGAVKIKRNSARLEWK